jgi:hypothetical protein
VTYVTGSGVRVLTGAGIAVFEAAKPLTAGEGYPVDFPPCSVSYFGTVPATSRNNLTTRSLTTQHL